MDWIIYSMLKIYSHKHMESFENNFARISELSKNCGRGTEYPPAPCLSPMYTRLKVLLNVIFVKAKHLKHKSYRKIFRCSSWSVHDLKAHNKLFRKYRLCNRKPTFPFQRHRSTGNPAGNWRGRQRRIQQNRFWGRKERKGLSEICFWWKYWTGGWEWP